MILLAADIGGTHTRIQMPYGGIYIVGGIAAKLVKQIEASDFLKFFQNKGRMSELITSIPLYIALCEYVGLQGTTVCAKNLCNY